MGTNVQSDSMRTFVAGGEAAAARSVRVKDDYLARALAGEAFLLFDGGMGTMLQAAGLSEAASPADLLNLSHPDEVAAIHRQYVEAGAQVITTNTFNANRFKLEGKASVAEVYAAGAEAARAAGAPYVAGDIGPTGALLAPMGTLSFDEAYEVFAEQACAVQAAGCDLVAIETMADLREMKAAVLAAVEHTDLPVFATMTFGEDGRTFLGTTPAIAASVLGGLGVAALGTNCSVGPVEVASMVKSLAAFAPCPVIAQPNAGLPRLVGGRTVYAMGPEEFAQAMAGVLDAGATIVGGCCGTTPAFVAALRALLDQRGPQGREKDASFVVASAQQLAVLPVGRPAVAVIGERINPTGKKRLARALREGDFDYIVGEAAAQAQAGADILDVNAGLPDIDEVATLASVVETLQATVTTPLQLDSSDPVALEAAVRSYPGKPLINSVNGKLSSLQAILPLVKRYGCAVVGLTLDEDGIPSTAEGRLAIAERIVAAAEAYGIPREDVAIDCLVMAAATNQREVMELLRAVTLVKERLGVRTVLGVSNVSFGMPQRGLVNATFLAAAFGAGLDMPILNPLSARYADTVAAFRVLNGQDAGAATFVQAYGHATDAYEVARRVEQGEWGSGAASALPSEAGAGASSECPIAVAETLSDAADTVALLASHVLVGRGKAAAALTDELLAGHDALDVVNQVFIPVLDVVGAKYEAGEFFLPQLMASAEAVKECFDRVREASGAGEAAADGLPDGSDRVIAVATVEGDIHDIGKNIAKMLLENYGFTVVDLGRDVAPEAVVEGARLAGAKLVGLSALMTTTVKAMERTVQLVHSSLPGVPVMVAGAVLTPEYAQVMGADYYAKDAAESARIATQLFAEDK